MSVDTTASGALPAVSSRLTSRVSLVLAFATTIVLMLPSVVWIVFDRRVWPWDQAWYGEVTADLYYTLTNNIDQWYHVMIAELPSKPPLLVWIGQFFVPFSYLTGSVDVALLISIVLTQSAALAIIFVAARRIAPQNPWASGLALVLAGTGPLFIGLSHQYLVEPMQTLVAAASLLLVIEARRLGPMSLALLLVIAVMAGFAVKTTSVIYSGAAWALCFYAVVSGVRRLGLSGAWTVRSGLLLLVAVVLTVVTLDWYVTNTADMLIHVRVSTTDASAELYGRRGTLLAKLPFWIHASNDAFFLAHWVLPLLLAVALVAMGLTAFRPSRVPFENWATVVAAVCFVQIIVPIVTLASVPAEETRYLEPIMPSLAILSAWVLRGRRLQGFAAILTVALLAQGIVVNAEALGMPTHLSNSAWLMPLHSDPMSKRIARDVVDATCFVSNRRQIQVVGPEFVDMNANSLEFISAKRQLRDGFRCYYTGLGYAETDVYKALARVATLKPRYVIFPISDLIASQPNAFNMILKPAEAAIASASNYRKTAQIGNYEIFQRTDTP